MLAVELQSQKAVLSLNIDISMSIETGKGKETRIYSWPYLTANLDNKDDRSLELPGIRVLEERIV